MDNRALQKIGYGLYVLTASSRGKDNGCIVNTFMQLTSSPVTVVLGVNKNNLTHDLIAETGRFNISALTEQTPFELIKRFGFTSGRDTDKFAGFDGSNRAANGIPYVAQSTCAYMSCTVTGTRDAGTHTLFFAVVDEGEVLSDVPALTYAYYHANVKPKPALAPAKETGKRVWRCVVCGYEYVGDELPADFECPVCRHGASDFIEVTGEGGMKPPAADEKQYNNEKSNNISKGEENKMKKWKCTICGEIVVSEERPDRCPLCKAPGEKFVEVKEDEKYWACEHVIGIAKDAPEEIKEGLRSNFQGECTEVGMYLAMSRAAAREGYPEIAEYWKTAAFEEAEHAAKFAELLGEVVSDSTAKNLAVRVEAECGATAGKFELAKKAKELGLDAIHDTVHEMAKDEARHGKAFEGLLNRYFGK